MFERIISIDWSGGKIRKEDDHVNLRITSWEPDQGFLVVRPPNARNQRRRWSRGECREWLAGQLRVDSPRTLVAMDFAFGLPWGIDRQLFQVAGWHEMLSKFDEVYSQNQTALSTALAINSKCQHSIGPYRLSKKDRTDFRFYLEHNISYYRLVEQIVPQAISVWYLGAGPKVGYHTLTGLPALHWLIQQREKGNIQFQVWPQETMTPEGHALVESYPALCRIEVDDWGNTRGQDERDAWKVLKQIEQANSSGSLEKWFQVPEITAGRYAGVSFQEQIQFEGFIFGVNPLCILN